MKIHEAEICQDHVPILMSIPPHGSMPSFFEVHEEEEQSDAPLRVANKNVYPPARALSVFQGCART